MWKQLRQAIASLRTLDIGSLLRRILSNLIDTIRSSTSGFVQVACVPPVMLVSALLCVFLLLKYSFRILGRLAKLVAAEIVFHTAILASASLRLGGTCRDILAASLDILAYLWNKLIDSRTVFATDYKGKHLRLIWNLLWQLPVWALTLIENLVVLAWFVAAFGGFAYVLVAARGHYGWLTASIALALIPPLLQRAIRHGGESTSGD